MTILSQSEGFYKFYSTSRYALHITVCSYSPVLFSLYKSTHFPYDLALMYSDHVSFFPCLLSTLLTRKSVWVVFGFYILFNLVFRDRCFYVKRVRVQSSCAQFVCTCSVTILALMSDHIFEPSTVDLKYLNLWITSNSKSLIVRFCLCLLACADYKYIFMHVVSIFIAY